MFDLSSAHWWTDELVNREKALKNRMITAAVAALLANGALAGTYQSEVGLLGSRTNVEGPRMDVDAATLTGSLYFKPVDDSKGPFLNATFLDHASGITVVRADRNAGLDDFSTFDARVVTGSGRVIEAGYSDIRGDDTYRLALGTYLTPVSQVLLSYTTSKDAAIDVMTAGYRRARKLGGTTALAYSFNAGYVDAKDSGYTANANAIYFLNRSFGIGVLASASDYNHARVRSGGLQATYFISSAFHLQGSVQRTDANGQDEETFGASVALRF
ncbi:MAG TPA: hypothetical protein VNR18_02180 [Hyphomicrobiales bacterium]|nr:hypothetical protein [Hyphomicrobiales bacterium]